MYFNAHGEPTPNQLDHQKWGVGTYTMGQYSTYPSGTDYTTYSNNTLVPEEGMGIQCTYFTCKRWSSTLIQSLG